MIKVTAIGNMGRDANLRSNAKGSFISLQLGADNGRETTWLDCTYSGEHANLMPYLKRGTQLYIEGLASVQAYIDDTGKAASVIKVVVTTLQLCGTREGACS